MSDRVIILARSFLISLCFLGVIGATSHALIRSFVGKPFFVLEEKASDGEESRLRYDDCQPTFLRTTTIAPTRPMAAAIVEAEILHVESSTVLPHWQRGPPAC